ncbi:predicted protein [Nematostella vectensis]|uniref:G-protein coupled receptors family 1 profile domain-containing protein n=1 Tax=Nematostella vectensis TaxID=45351 RepID=A7SJS9_NEMVE|nr:predicted protein [Nematostella vectensis]|eukprot:XP_001628117.1 predicted protein [Nematostella vectensis]
MEGKRPLNFTNLIPPSIGQQTSNLSVPGNLLLGGDLLLLTDTTSSDAHSYCDYSLDLVFLVVDAFLGVLILAGNLFTCAVFIFGGNLRRSSSYMNVFLLSLSVSDILLALIVIPSYGSHCTGCRHSLSSFCWMFEGGKDYTFLASVFNLSAISYDRYLAVFKPLLYSIQMSPRRVLALLLLVWVLPGMLAALRNTWQHMSDHALVARININYTYILLFVFVIIPITLVSVVNFRIIQAIKKQSRRVKGAATPNGTLAGITLMLRDTHEARRVKGTVACVLVVALFVTCWLPRACYFFLRLSGRPEVEIRLLMKMSVSFLLFQSSLNPVVYSFYRTDFRQAAKRVLRCDGR